jgi:probable F420-dependent oxidoreductase
LLTTDNPLSCGPLIVAAANATTRLRVGSYVYNNDLRHPALLAKEAATIDVLSGGRLELGIGAGWNKPEYDMIGLSFDPPAIRAARFKESLEIITRLLTGEELSYQGQYYQISRLEGMPLPIQQPIPLLIGGGGPSMIRIAARRANIIGFVPRSLPGGGLDDAKFAAETLDSNIEILETAVAKSERVDGGPERSILLFSLHSSLADVPEDNWIPRDLVETSPYALIGDTNAMADTLAARRERWGLNYFVCFDTDLEKFIPVVHKLSGTV